jgi:hypothetical protein
MLNFSKKAAERYHLNWNDLPERKGDFWKIDITMIGRTPMILIIHEYTLFTLVRKKSGFKRIDDISNEIIHCCHWYKCKETVSLGKNTDRKLNGSINEIKNQIWFVDSPDSINRMEMTINGCLYSYLSDKKYDYGTPFEAVDLYDKGLWPRHNNGAI